MYPVKHSYASFTGGVLFEKRIEEYSLEELKRQFDMYNVTWVVCWLDRSKEFFNRHPGYLTKAGEIATFTIYRVNRKPSFFIKGSGEVRADYNRLELRQVAAEGNEIIISYHWMRQLKTEPAAKLEKFFTGSDPVGFIRIIDPPESLVIYNRY
jgi:hypothetical protein